MKINYKAFIEDNFCIGTPTGEIVPFKFNDIQGYYYDILINEYPTMQGIRENILKSRRFGFSSVIDGIFTVDFIMSELGMINRTNSDVYSYKDSDTLDLFRRVNMFIDSWLIKREGGSYLEQSHRGEAPRLRKQFLEADKDNLIIGRNGSEYHCKTAGAKVSGRGGTKQNIHWSEVAFYNNTEILNAEDLVTGAEEQVGMGIGKIFRETTGNAADDFYTREYEAGKNGTSDFKSRFLAWYLHKNYNLLPPTGWEPPVYYDKARREHNVTREQCYWHYQKTRELKNEKRMREYPTDDTEAFLLGGSSYFDKGALLHYKNAAIKPIKEVEFVGAL